MIWRRWRRDERKGKMGDTGDGSSAAQSAHPTEDTDNRGIWHRLTGLLSSEVPATEAERRANGTRSPDLPGKALAIPGVANLRRMRVDDVSIPKAELVAVPVDISKAALVEVFRD